jgi:hypothetical protein
VLDINVLVPCVRLKDFMAGQQRILTLAFLTPTPEDHRINRLVAQVSRHPFCHVELYFEGTQLSFSVMWGETAGFRSKNLSNPNYTLVSLCVSQKEFDATLEFCRSTARQDLCFDERGMWASWFPRIGCCVEPTSQQRGATFCSKIITEALQFGGIKEVETACPSTTTPSSLFERVKGSRRIACNSVPFKRQALMSLPVTGLM